MRRGLPVMVAALIWAALIAGVVAPLLLSLQSPLLQWRAPVYVVAGAAGVLGMGLMLLQPLLAAGWVPALSPYRARRLHRVVGVLLLLAVIVHVAALWLTSPPDVIDALLFASPTPFSVWGVLAMWALFATALTALWRKRIGLRLWRGLHAVLAVVIALGTVLHALPVDGTMEPVSKAGLCVAVAVATGVVLMRARWSGLRRRAAAGRG